ncbi:MAG: hypothetical protein OSA97_05865 [Nevskia sp.]|nr:hypothetical protein [Nevskia sp.]
MPKFTIDVREEDLRDIERGLARMNHSDGNSHGPLDVHRLAGMLLQDVALAVRRPGSWEGDHMSQLCSHGYPL